MVSADTVLKVQKFINVLELSGITLILLLAFVFQFLLNELPCPLCILQRIGFLLMTFGFLMNLRFGLRPSHYAISLIAALFTAFVAMRQIALHVVPGTGSYGEPFLGLHLYTWAFILAIIVDVVTTLILGMDRQYLTMENTKEKPQFHWMVPLLFALVIFLIVGNIVSVYFECGLAECPDNPTHYLIKNVWTPQA